MTASAPAARRMPAIHFGFRLMSFFIFTFLLTVDSLGMGRTAHCTLLCGRWVNDGFHLSYGVRGKVAASRVLANHLRVGRDVDAKHLLRGHVTLNPLNLRTKVV